VLDGSAVFLTGVIDDCCMRPPPAVRNPAPVRSVFEDSDPPRIRRPSLMYGVAPAIPGCASVRPHAAPPMVSRQSHTYSELKFKAAPPGSPGRRFPPVGGARKSRSTTAHLRVQQRTTAIMREIEVHMRVQDPATSRARND
jgi:hypothetical protein